MNAKCKASSQELARNLGAVFSSESIEGSFYLSTLSESMDNIINNLSSRNANRLMDIEPEMLNISQRRAQPTDEKAMYTKVLKAPDEVTNDDVEGGLEDTEENDVEEVG